MEPELGSCQWDLSGSFKARAPEEKDPGSGYLGGLCLEGWSHSTPGQETVLDNTQGPGMPAALGGSVGQSEEEFLRGAPVQCEAKTELEVGLLISLQG